MCKGLQYLSFTNIHTPPPLLFPESLFLSILSKVFPSESGSFSVSQVSARHIRSRIPAERYCMLALNSSVLFKYSDDGRRLNRNFGVLNFILPIRIDGYTISMVEPHPHCCREHTKFHDKVSTHMENFTVILSIKEFDLCTHTA